MLLFMSSFSRERERPFVANARKRGGVWCHVSPRFDRQSSRARPLLTRLESSSWRQNSSMGCAIMSLLRFRPPSRFARCPLCDFSLKVVVTTTRFVQTINTENNRARRARTESKLARFQREWDALSVGSVDHTIRAWDAERALSGGVEQRHQRGPSSSASSLSAGAVPNARAYSAIEIRWSKSDLVPIHRRARVGVVR